MPWTVGGFETDLSNVQDFFALETNERTYLSDWKRDKNQHK